MAKSSFKRTLKKIAPEPIVTFVQNNISNRPPGQAMKNISGALFSPILNSRYKAQLKKIYDTRYSKGAEAYDLFCDSGENFWHWLIQQGLNIYPGIQEKMPYMPDEELQLQFTGNSGRKTLEEAFNFYSLIKNTAGKYGVGFGKECKILDYGCGWGRILRFFLKEVPERNLFGTDCDEEIIKICKATNLKCNLVINDIYPPVAFENETFDIIYSYSVFSHLSEDAHLKWIGEFSRILKPGGILIVTTRDRDFILACEGFRKMPDTEIPFYAKGLSKTFVETQKNLELYDSGHFLYEPVGGGDLREGSFYGETCIPEKYVYNNWNKFFTKLDFINHKEHRKFDQNTIIAVK